MLLSFSNRVSAGDKKLLFFSNPLYTWPGKIFLVQFNENSRLEKDVCRPCFLLYFLCSWLQLVVRFWLLCPLLDGCFDFESWNPSFLMDGSLVSTRFELVRVCFSGLTSEFWYFMLSDLNNACRMFFLTSLVKWHFISSTFTGNFTTVQFTFVRPVICPPLFCSFPAIYVFATLCRSIAVGEHLDKKAIF